MTTAPPLTATQNAPAPSTAAGPATGSAAGPAAGSAAGPDEWAAVLAQIAERADAVDRGEVSARGVLAPLARAGVLDLGAPANAGGALPAMAQAVEDIARECVSSAFTTWAQRVTIEYLASADTDYAREVVRGLRDGTTPGVTGMASAFRELSGCGSLDLTATSTAGGHVVSGRIRWASNLYDDACVVSAARTDAGERIVFAASLATPGLSAGRPFPLLGLNATASSTLTFDEVFVGRDQVLSTDFERFLSGVRGTFLLLQTALCLGLAATALEQVRGRLTGLNAVFTGDADRTFGRWHVARTALHDLAARVGGSQPPTRLELLSLRLAAAEVATDSSTLEVKTAGGGGYARHSGASRCFRESFFVPVQSPSEAQLRWELAQCRS